MKKLILICLFLNISCDKLNRITSQKSYFEINRSTYKVIEIDSCEYVINIYAKESPIHKNNCKFCKNRK
jgi:hypothetical protein